MMFFDFISKLKPVFERDVKEYGELLDTFKSEFRSNEPVLCWYPSSGFDLKALVYLNEKDTSEVYKTPTVDVFVFSDFNRIFSEKFVKMYDYFEMSAGILFADSRTLIKTTQIIPLNLFGNREIREFVNKRDYKKWVDEIGNLINMPQFWFFMIEIESNYFGYEYFPLLFCNIENRFLREELWKKYNVKFDYICAVSDGCAFGGNNECINMNFKDYLPVMKEEKYWITDHKRDGVPDSFKCISLFNNWGKYGMPDNFECSQNGRFERRSYLFKISD